MAIISPNLDFTARDFDSLAYRLQSLVRSVYPDWTDFSVANFGNILLELFAHVGEVLAYYQDAQAAEAFWPTVTQRLSAIRLGRLIGFSLTGATAASGTVTFSLPFVAPKTVTIPVGTQLYTADPEEPLPFRTTAAATIAVGATSADVTVEQARVHTMSLSSSEEPNQEFILPVTPYLEGTAEVEAGDGTYTLVTSFLGYTSTDRVFAVQIDEADRGHLMFGNGATAAIPQGQIDVTYKSGGGALGNVEAGKIVVINDSIFYSDGSPAPVSATNAAAASGGTDRMSIAEARVQAPASLRVLTRTVAREDFETVAKSVRGVARALMATANEYAGMPENTGVLHVVAQGSRLTSGRVAPAAPTAAMLDEIEAEINTNKPPTITFTFEAVAATFKDITVSARIYIKRGYTPATVGANIRLALADFFAAQLENGTDNPDIDFGANLCDTQGEILGELAWSDVFNVIRDVEGVRKVDEGVQGVLINGRRSTLTLTPIEFPRFLSATLTDVDTGASI